MLDRSFIGESGSREKRTRNKIWENNAQADCGSKAGKGPLLYLIKGLDVGWMTSLSAACYPPISSRTFHSSGRTGLTDRRD